MWTHLDVRKHTKHVTLRQVSARARSPRVETRHGLAIHCAAPYSTGSLGKRLIMSYGCAMRTRNGREEMVGTVSCQVLKGRWGEWYGTVGAQRRCAFEKLSTPKQGGFDWNHPIKPVLFPRRVARMEPRMDPR